MKIWSAWRTISTRSGVTSPRMLFVSLVSDLKMRVWVPLGIVLPNSKTRAWERMPHNKVMGDTELSSKITDLVLEELTQRLNKLQPLTIKHALGKRKVVVGFNSGTGALERDAIGSMSVIISIGKTLRTRQG